MRVPTWSVLLPLSMPAAACGGDDLTLPGQGDPAALSIVAGDGQRGPLGETLMRTTAAAAAPEAGTGMVTVRTRKLVAVWPLRCAQGDSEDGIRAA
jgi:hypothetical protein